MAFIATGRCVKHEKQEDHRAVNARPRNDLTYRRTALTNGYENGADDQRIFLLVAVNIL